MRREQVNQRDAGRSKRRTKRDLEERACAASRHADERARVVRLTASTVTAEADRFLERTAA